MGEHHCTESQDNCRAGTAIGSRRPCPAPLHLRIQPWTYFQYKSPLLVLSNPDSRGLGACSTSRWCLQFATFLPKRILASKQPGQHLSPLWQLHILQGHSCNAQLSGFKAGGHHISFPAVSPGPSWSPTVVMLSPEVQSSSVKPGCSCTSEEEE